MGEFPSNGGDEIPVCEGKTVYGFAPQGVVTLNLHFYKKRIT